MWVRKSRWEADCGSPSFPAGVCSQRRNHVTEHLQEPGPFLQHLSFSSSTEPLSDTQSLLQTPERKPFPTFLEHRVAIGALEHTSWSDQIASSLNRKRGLFPSPRVGRQWYLWSPLPSHRHIFTTHFWCRYYHQWPHFTDLKTETAQLTLNQCFWCQTQHLSPQGLLIKLFVLLYLYLTLSHYAPYILRSVF